MTEEWKALGRVEIAAGRDPMRAAVLAERAGALCTVPAVVVLTYVCRNCYDLLPKEKAPCSNDECRLGFDGSSQEPCPWCRGTGKEPWPMLSSRPELEEYSIELGARSINEMPHRLDPCVKWAMHKLTLLRMGLALKGSELSFHIGPGTVALTKIWTWKP